MRVLAKRALVDIAGLRIIGDRRRYLRGPWSNQQLEGARGEGRRRKKPEEQPFPPSGKKLENGLST